jgi:hypothetical protein
MKMVVNGTQVHVQMLQTEVEHKSKTFAHTCSQSPHFCHLEILKYLQKNGCPWNSNVCSFAAKNGHIEVIKWSRENGCEWDSYTSMYAALNGRA